MNDNKREEDVLRQVAEAYTEEYGRQLLRENHELNRQGIAYFTPRLDKKVGRIGRGRRFKKYLPVLAAAACIAVFLLVPLLRLPGPPFTETPASADGSANSYEVVPLSFTLPEGIVLAGFEQDKGKSIYYLEDAYQDDVVLTLEYTKDDFDSSGFQPVEVNGETVYAVSEEDYKLIVFEKAEVLYTLACRYDINTLVRLSRNIV